MICFCFSVRTTKPKPIFCCLLVWPGPLSSAHLGSWTEALSVPPRPDHSPETQDCNFCTLTLLLMRMLWLSFAECPWAQGWPLPCTKAQPHRHTKLSLLASWDFSKFQPGGGMMCRSRGLSRLFMWDSVWTGKLLNFTSQGTGDTGTGDNEQGQQPAIACVFPKHPVIRRCLNSPAGAC